MAAENYYEILGLRKGAGDEDVKQAFRELAKSLHPDRNPDDPDAERRFKLVTTAYEALKDSSRRRAYDEWLAFARKHERSRLTQWTRLAAVAAFLLLGPSVALYWAYVLLDGWDTPQSGSGPVAVAVNAKRPPEKAVSRGHAEHNGELGTSTTAKEDAVPLPAAKSDALREPAKPAPAPRPSAEVTQSKVAKEETTAALPAPEPPAPAPAAAPAKPATPVTTAPVAPPAKPPLPEAAAPAAPPDTRPSAPAQGAPPSSSAAKSNALQAAQANPPSTGAKIQEDEETAPPAAPEPVASLPSSPERAERDRDRPEIAAVEETEKAPTSPPDAAAEQPEQERPRLPVKKPVSPPRQTQESAARGMARIIAELKEPEAVLRRSAAGDSRQAPLRPEESVLPEASPESIEGGDFSDCDRCPVMSVVTATDFLRPRSGPRGQAGHNLAVSKFEVTIAEWNVCVQEGACRSLDLGRSAAQEPVNDVSRDDASAYAQWLSRKTGKSYRLMKVGGWNTDGQSGPRAEQGPRLRQQPRGQDCDSPDWNWLSDADCASRNRRAAQGEATAGPSGDESEPSQTISGFRVARTLRPDG